MPFLLPLHREQETDTLLAFRHPEPAYPFHIILVPKKKIGSFSDLAPGDPFLSDVVCVTQKLVEDFHLTTYRLVVNGGGYQEFPLLHFHLISEATNHA